MSFLSQRPSARLSRTGRYRKVCNPRPSSRPGWSRSFACCLLSFCLSLRLSAALRCLGRDVNCGKSHFCQCFCVAAHPSLARCLQRGKSTKIFAFLCQIRTENRTDIWCPWGGAIFPFNRHSIFFSTIPLDNRPVLLYL